MLWSNPVPVKTDTGQNRYWSNPPRASVQSGAWSRRNIRRRTGQSVHIACCTVLPQYPLLRPRGAISALAPRCRNIRRRAGQSAGAGPGSLSPCGRNIRARALLPHRPHVGPGRRRRPPLASAAAASRPPGRAKRSSSFAAAAAIILSPTFIQTSVALLSIFSSVLSPPSLLFWGSATSPCVSRETCGT